MFIKCAHNAREGMHNANDHCYSSKSSCKPGICWQLMCTSGRMPRIAAAFDKLTPWGGEGGPFVLSSRIWIS